MAEHKSGAPMNIYFDSISMDRKIRHDPDLITTINSLGKKANGIRSKLYTVEIPVNAKYVISLCDLGGGEFVEEVSRIWM